MNKFISVIAGLLLVGAVVEGTPTLNGRTYGHGVDGFGFGPGFAHAGPGFGHAYPGHVEVFDDYAYDGFGHGHRYGPGFGHGPVVFDDYDYAHGPAYDGFRYNHGADAPYLVQSFDGQRVRQADGDYLVQTPRGQYREPVYPYGTPYY